VRRDTFFVPGRRVALVLTVIGALVPAASAHARAPFDRAVVVVFENKSPAQVIGSSDAPTFTSYARRYATLAAYGGVAHPSLPNYIALISGSTHGIHSDCTDCTVSARNLADTLEARHRTWKVYAEGLPSVGFTGADSKRYAKRHEPFVYFRDVFSDPARLRRIVPYTQWSPDLAGHRLPTFSLVVPDVCDDMHDCPVSTGDAWLKRFLPPLLASPQMRRGAVFVITDEGQGSDPGAPGGAAPALVAGPTVKRRSRYRPRITQYGILRTIEDAFGLPRLGRSAQAHALTGIWR
jgi:phosphatidylinositol-3-phosphatase